MILDSSVNLGDVVSANVDELPDGSIDQIAIVALAPFSPDRRMPLTTTYVVVKSRGATIVDRSVEAGSKGAASRQTDVLRWPVGTWSGDGGAPHRERGRRIATALEYAARLCGGLRTPDPF